MKNSFTSGPPMPVRGRAETPEQKRAIIERLYAAWLANPQQRLGQLVASATFTYSEYRTFDPFSIEDFPLIEAIERLGT